MRVLELEAGKSPGQWGMQHGESFRDLIAEIAEIRLDLTVELGGFPDRAAVLALAERHLPVLEAWSADAYAELLGIAEASNLDAARLLVLNHYTDLRDLGPLGGRPEPRPEDDCSVLYARGPHDAFLGQTWDMHGSAEGYVTMMRVPGQSRGSAEGEAHPDAWILSIVGCLGMTGINSAGVGVCINNLRSTDARVGVVWPALIRRVLQQRMAADARDTILAAPLGSGHSYTVASLEGVYAIETSGQKKTLIVDGAAETFVHTNHCLDPDVASCTTVHPESGTHERYAALRRSVDEKAVADRADLWRRLGSHDGYPRSVCTHLATPTEPHGIRTCGAIVMDLGACDAWAGHGCVHRSLPQAFRFYGDQTVERRSIVPLGLGRL